MGSRTRGRPPTRWIDNVENDLKTLNIKNWQRVAAYRWNCKKRAVEAAKTCVKHQDAVYKFRAHHHSAVVPTRYHSKNNC
ncbi:hypothetical protein TNCV_1853791 [Trichonephila clavipes]|nr:hypothetical protein TNCV_1853791 [Trichonephila clavipes]